MPLIAGLIRPEEDTTAFGVRHSNQPQSAAPWCSPPAVRTDGKLNGQNTLPMGARLQLDPALNLDSLRISPQTKIVAKAMQRYGLYCISVFI